MKILQSNKGSSILFWATMALSTSTMMVYGQSCANDKECSEFQYCAAGQCLNHLECNVDVDCLNPSNMYNLASCIGYIECQSGFCGIVCDESPSSPCKDGSEPVNCLVSPCSTSTCENYVTCIDDYCGETCTAIHLDSAGFVVCEEDDVIDNAAGGDPDDNVDNSGVDDPNLPKICSTDKDCAPPAQIERIDGSMEYCAQGVCMPYGSCTSDFDCFNPSNEFFAITCIGYTKCFDDGQCGVVCTEDRICDDDGTAIVDCFASPCEVSSCDVEGAVCVDSFCGECSALYYNVSGSQVCTDADSGLGVSQTTCVSSDDCAPDEEYCAQGICMSFGACGSDLDCFNPNNSYPMIECEGYRKCFEDGQCGVVCNGDSLCDDDGTTFVFCDTSPCAVSTCVVADGFATSCVDDRCGECSAVHFDSAGNEACRINTDGNLGVSLNTCTTSEDCITDEQYCADSQCLEYSSCFVDEDCINVENIFAQDDCIGTLLCQQSQCIKECTDEGDNTGDVNGAGDGATDDDDDDDDSEASNPHFVSAMSMCLLVLYGSMMLIL